MKDLLRDIAAFAAMASFVASVAIVCIAMKPAQLPV